MNIAPIDLVVPQGWETVTFAKVQPQYLPLPALRSVDGRVVSRWQPTEQERARIAAGADIYLTVHTFNQALQPQLVTVGGAPVEPIPAPAGWDAFGRPPGGQQVTRESLDVLGEIEARANAASPAPWHDHGKPHPSTVPAQKEAAGVSSSEALIYSTRRDYVCLPETFVQQLADATFIAAARTDVPRLVAALRIALDSIWCEGGMFDEPPCRPEAKCRPCSDKTDALAALSGPKVKS